MLFSGRDFPTLEQSKHSPKRTGGAASAFPLPNRAPDLTDTAPHRIELFKLRGFAPFPSGEIPHTSLKNKRAGADNTPTVVRASFRTPRLFITTVLTADPQGDLLYQTAPTASHSPPTEQQPVAQPLGKGLVGHRYLSVWQRQEFGTESKYYGMWAFPPPQEHPKKNKTLFN